MQQGDDEQEEIAAVVPDNESDKKKALRDALSNSSSFSLSLSLRRRGDELHEQHAGSRRDDEAELKWAAIERLPTMDRLHTSLPLHANNAGPVDVRSLGVAERRALVHTLIGDIHDDNLRLLREQQHRMDRVGVHQPTVEVRWQNLCVDAECQVVHGKPIPTLLNSAISTLSVCSFVLLSTAIAHLSFVCWLLKCHYSVCRCSPPCWAWDSTVTKKGSTSSNMPQASSTLPGNYIYPWHTCIIICHSVLPSFLMIWLASVQHCRMTLLLGPPGCGKTTLLLALAGKLNKNLKVPPSRFHHLPLFFSCHFWVACRSEIARAQNRACRMLSSYIYACAQNRACPMLSSYIYALVSMIFMSLRWLSGRRSTSLQDSRVLAAEQVTKCSFLSLQNM